ncbi:MAG TPA: hypothetical protein VFI26_09325 [Lysobacter sp.]|nr:hypothetical protein [Lysobacter sp.]
MNRSALRFALLALALPAAIAACDKPAAAPGAAGDAPSATPATASAGDRLAAAADAINPATSPREAVIAAMHKFVGVHSYHATMSFDGGPRGPMTNQLDFVAPDRFRMEIAGMGAQYVIGDTMYMQMHGRSMQVPMPKGTVTRWRDPASLAEAEAGMTVDEQGQDSVDGQPATRYVVRVTQPKETTTTLWIGDAGLPLQILAHNAMGDATIKYSHFDDPAIVIEPPK